MHDKNTKWHSEIFWITNFKLCKQLFCDDLVLNLNFRFNICLRRYKIDKSST